MPPSNSEPPSPAAAACSLGGGLCHLDDGPSPSPPRRSRSRRIAVGVACAAAAAGVVAAAGPFLTPALRRHALPYLPATPAQIDNVFALLRRNGLATGPTPSRPLRLVDLGSGDGRVVRAAAARSYQATGVDLNWPLVAFSRLASARLACLHRPRYLRADLLRHSLAGYDIVLIFGVESIMRPLEARLAAELQPTACVVACRYQLPGWPHCDWISDGVDSVWLYRKPAVG